MCTVAQHACQRRSCLNTTRLGHEQRGAGSRDREDVEVIASTRTQNRWDTRGGRGQHRGHGTDQGGTGLVARGHEGHARARGRRRHDARGVPRAQVQEHHRSCAREIFDEAGGTGAGNDAGTLDAAHRSALQQAHAAVTQALVGQLVNADLRVRAGVADLEANDLPRGGVRGQRR